MLVYLSDVGFSILDDKSSTDQQFFPVLDCTMAMASRCLARRYAILLLVFRVMLHPIQT